MFKETTEIEIFLPNGDTVGKRFRDDFDAMEYLANSDPERGKEYKIVITERVVFD